MLSSSIVTSTPQEEIVLMERVAARDQTAFADLYDKFAPMIYGMSVQILQNKTLAEEATQDTFLKVWNQVETWNPERGKVVTWLLTIARYTAIDRLRREKRQSPWTSIGLETVFNHIGIVDVVDGKRWSDAELLSQLVEQLPREQVEAIELAFFYGMSHTEIAASLGEPLGTIKSRIRLGLQKLKSLWINSLDE